MISTIQKAIGIDCIKFLTKYRKKHPGLNIENTL